MTVTVQSMVDKILIGNDAGWLLSFYNEEVREGRHTILTKPVAEFGRDQYYADIRASLPSNLEGGIYTFVIEGLTDGDYQKIAQQGESGPKVVKLFLYWRDTNASLKGYLKNVTGLTDSFSRVTSADLSDCLVAVLRVVSVKRKAGSRRYETTIEAREWVYEVLARERLAGPLDAPDLLAAANTVASNAGIPTPAQPYTFTSAPDTSQSSPHSGTDEQTLKGQWSLLDTLRELGRRMEQRYGLGGRGVYLIRNGVLHAGERPFPLEGLVRDLTQRNGLLETEKEKSDSASVASGERPQNPGSTRDRYKLTCKGRPDIKPGDVLRFDEPVEEMGTTRGGWAGAIGDMVRGPIVPVLADWDMQNEARLYVTSVDHRLSRTQGFVSTIVGVKVESIGQVWDTPTSGTAEQDAAQAIEGRLRRFVSTQRGLDAGEVRRVHTEGQDEPPSQTLDIWRGLAGGDGKRNQVRRLKVQRQRPNRDPVPGVAYLTPFAWGKCGLVLPRYPGTRVLVGHRQGHGEDPVEIGALWESGCGPESQAGDWWLILPVGVPSSQRTSLADDATPQAHTGKVTQDLIDADGHRLIEVGELTIRVGERTLKNTEDSPLRPARPEDENSVTIEHTGSAEANRSRITMKQDGTVVITAKNIQLLADQEIKLEANNVRVKVGGTMDVAGK